MRGCGDDVCVYVHVHVCIYACVTSKCVCFVTDLIKQRPQVARAGY